MHKNSWIKEGGTYKKPTLLQPRLSWTLLGRGADNPQENKGKKNLALRPTSRNGRPPKGRKTTGPKAYKPKQLTQNERRNKATKRAPHKRKLAHRPTS